MDGYGVLYTLAGGLAGALVFGYLARRIKLSPIVGYLLAGVAASPFTPGYVANRDVSEQFANIGVILLMFTIGLRFNLRDLFAVWKVAIPGALIQSTVSTIVMGAILHWMGWTWTSGLVLGMAISVASTVVMATVLAERHDLHATIGHIAVGWTVVEDLLTVSALLLLPIFFGAGAEETQSATAALGFAGLKIVGLGVLVYVLGKWIFPWALEQVAKTRSSELFTLSVIVVAIGVAAISAGVFGVSLELGAFLGGLAVGRSEFSGRAAGDAVPMRDAFAVLFFVSIGMLFDPKAVINEPLVLTAVLFVIVIVKPVTAFLTVLLLGRPIGTAIPVGATFSQVGEFSFILGVVARQLGIMSDSAWNALVAASVISIAMNPWIYGTARRLSSRAKKGAPSQHAEKLPIDPKKCVLLGFGPVGQIVYRLLTDQGSQVTVIELNLDTVRALKAKGINAVYGDVLRPGTLEDAGIATCSSLILSADVEDAAELIRRARQINPELRVLARCTHLRDAAAIKKAGADVVAAGEAEVGVALFDAMTRHWDMDTKDATELRHEVRTKLYEKSAQAAPG